MYVSIHWGMGGRQRGACRIGRANAQAITPGKDGRSGRATVHTMVPRSGGRAREGVAVFENARASSLRKKKSRSLMATEAFPVGYALSTAWVIRALIAPALLTTWAETEVVVLALLLVKMHLLCFLLRLKCHSMLYYHKDSQKEALEC